MKLIVTLGPATRTLDDLKRLKDRGVSFVRLNMSHSSLEDLAECLEKARAIDLPFVIDTEGSQVRTGFLRRKTIALEEQDTVRIYADRIIGDGKQFCLTPGYVTGLLQEGDLLHIDFDTAILRVCDLSTLNKGYVLAKAVSGGAVGQNKAVIIDQVFDRKITMPVLTEKDHKAIALGRQAGVRHVAVSFVRSAACLDEVRRVTVGTMEIISKIECLDALKNLDEILAGTDFVLIDRGT
ncbi:MAG: hypothetical protein IPL39_09230 [Opitutaceae bacterium]|nr:hypothetical protein [Opitutaceae bacterium]